jgi:hypothetical protein
MNIDLTEEDINGLSQPEELSPEDLKQISGGHDRNAGYVNSGNKCSASPYGEHDFVYTGQTRPGVIWGDTWPDYLYKCQYCGKERWDKFW